jgi:hypothetical protein
LITSSTVNRTQNGELLIELLDKTKNLDVLQPDEIQFLSELNRNRKRMGKNFDFTPNNVNRLRKIVVAVCWDVVK